MGDRRSSEASDPKGEVIDETPPPTLRSPVRTASESVFVFPPFRLDAVNEQLWHEQQLVALRRKPFAILRYLLEQRGRLVSKEELLTKLWRDEYVSEGVLKTHFTEIRKALGDSPKHPTFIETAHGRGYRFVGAVECLRGPLRLQSPPLAHVVAESIATVVGPPLVGRDRELRRLEQAMEAVMSRRRQVLFVTGEPGIGKTQLVKRFVEQASGKADVLVAWGQCVDQYGAGEPYLPILEALRRLCRGPEGEFIRAVMSRNAPTWLTQVPSLLDQAPSPQIPARASAGTPERLLREATETLEAISERHALLLWLEDLHWADPSTLDLVSYVAQRADPARLVLLATYRPFQAATTQRLLLLKQHLKMHDQCDELPLGYLSLGDVGEYLGARFASHRFPAGLMQLLYQLTNGNPLFMVTVVDSWLERGALSRQTGEWAFVGNLRELAQEMPQNLSRMLELEVERLHGFERSVIDAASVVGNEFSTAAVAAALEENVVRVEEVCTRLGRSAQFLRTKGTSEWPDQTQSMLCEFVHEFYRQVVYSQIGTARLAELHQRIGARQENGYGKFAIEIAPELAMHFERGRDLPRAIRYLRLAADRASRRSAYPEAVTHLQNALALLRKLTPSEELLGMELELCLAIGASLAVLKGYGHSDVEHVYLRAKALWETLGKTPEIVPAMANIGAFFLLRADYARGRHSFEQLLSFSKSSSDADAEGQAHMGLGILELFHGEPKRAQAHFDQALRQHDPERDLLRIVRYMQHPGVIARCYSSFALILLGYPDRALERANESLSYAKKVAEPFATAFGLRAVIYVQQFRGEHAEAQKHAQAMLKLSQEHGFRLHRAMATLACGEALVALGDLPQGIRLLQESWEDYRATGTEVAATYWQSRLVEAYYKAGRISDALGILEQLFVKVQSLDEHWWEAELYRLQGELVIRAREGAETACSQSAALADEHPETKFLQALEIARQRDQKAFELRAAMSLARVTHKTANGARGYQALAQVYARFDEGFETADLRNAKLLLEDLSTSS